MTHRELAESLTAKTQQLLTLASDGSVTASADSLRARIAEAEQAGDHEAAATAKRALLEVLANREHH